MDIKREYQAEIITNAAAIYASLDITQLIRIIGNREKAVKLSNMFLKIARDREQAGSKAYEGFQSSLVNFNSNMGVDDND